MLKILNKSEEFQTSSSCVGCRCNQNFWHRFQTPSSSSMSSKLLLSLSFSCHHVVPLLHVIYFLWSCGRLAPAWRQNIFEQLHTCCLWLRLLCLGNICAADVVCRYFCVHVCLTTTVQGIALCSISRNELNGP